MSVTVTASSPSSKPRFTISISSSNGSAITAVTLTRTVQGSTEQTRFQPTAGPSPRIVNDYEFAWDTTVTYTATVTSGAGTETFTSGPISLSPDRAWIIHPTTPGLSMVLDTASFDAIGIGSAGTVSRPSATTAHDVIGAKYRVITKAGPRQASRTQIEIRTVTTFEQQALWAVLDDQTPLLIRVPSAWGWDWEDGYYDVGQVDSNRLYQYGPEPGRRFTLPLERVESPVGTQQADRTYTDVDAQFATYQAIPGTYATYADLLTDVRR